MNYDHKKIEDKWRKIWNEAQIYKTDFDSKDPKCYVLDMFPYPSGEGLHVGHPKGYIATDVYSRYKKMKGFNVLHPMGWDAFGLPAENYAIKNKIHPRLAVEKNIEIFKKQLDVIGFNYDWSKEINTTDPRYYKWTQWIFLKLHEKGLARLSYEPINWCPSCQTGLANEDLDDGKCERCGSVVEKKPMRQWVLKITEYAERLLNDLEKLNWPEHIKESQKNWIGRSEGLLFRAPVKGTDLYIETFSAHFEAMHADTFVVIAPDHAFLPTLIEAVKSKDEIMNFATELVRKRSIQGYEGEKEPEGIFTGRYIVDPLGNGDLPIWIANFAIAEYGTGIVKASAHDERDFAFAKKYGIKLKTVLYPRDIVEAEKVKKFEYCYSDMKNGIIVEPEEFNGCIARDVRDKVAQYAIDKGYAVRKVSYKLRDWVFSRQRYWGEPIPVIFCANCAKDSIFKIIDSRENVDWTEIDGVKYRIVPVPEKDLPVTLPEVESYEPTGTGESPLANIREWVNTACPVCGGKAKRETNTMPQWAGSSWYYLAYLMSNNSGLKIQDSGIKNIFDNWLPVDVYVGGAEHATRHLIYARFWHKFLFDVGIVSTDEPFDKLHNVGLIIGEDGRKMSKRFGNVINPNVVVEQFGADCFRVYEMFMGPFNSSIAWCTDNMVGSRRFIEKIWRLADKVSSDSDDEQIVSVLNQTIIKVSSDIELFKFNTAISSLMILANELDSRTSINKNTFDVLLKLLSPFAPHVSQELWSLAGNSQYIISQSWPIPTNLGTQKSISKIVIQINGKVRDSFECDSQSDDEQRQNTAINRPTVRKWIDGKKIAKIIHVKDKLINIVLE